MSCLPKHELSYTCLAEFLLLINHNNIIMELLVIINFVIVYMYVATENFHAQNNIRILLGDCGMSWSKLSSYVYTPVQYYARIAGHIFLGGIPRGPSLPLICFQNR